MRRPTFSEINWPLNSAALELAEKWANEASERFIDWLWRSFDQLLEEAPALRTPAPDYEAFERSLTHHHYIFLSQIVTRETNGYAAFTVHHEMPELESRKAAPAMPPAYDLAFVWNANPRVAWPIEAKVVPTPATLSPYLGDTNKIIQFGAPFAGEAAQIAYFLSGEPCLFFDNISHRGEVALAVTNYQSTRPQMVSCHHRSNKPTLRIHHLVMCIGEASKQKKSEQ